MTMQLVLFAAGVGFLLGFRISNWMSKRHLEKLKRIWSLAGLRGTPEQVK